MNRNQFEQEFDRALRSAPEFHLPKDFSDQVVNKIDHRTEIEQRRQAIFMVAGIVAFLLLSAICLAIYVDMEVLQQLMGISGWGVLTGLLVVAIQLLDQNLLHHRRARLG